METVNLAWKQKTSCSWDLGGYRDSYKLEDGRRIFMSIDVEDNPLDPREWDNMGTMVTWHKRKVEL